MKETTNSLSEYRQKSVRETRHKLELALQRLIDRNPQVVAHDRKISATSVAEEAGIDRVTLYRFHEPILAEINRLNNATSESKLSKNRMELGKASSQLKEYRNLVQQAQHEVALLARINYNLDARINELEKLLELRDKVIQDLRKQMPTFGKQLKFQPNGSS